MPREVCLFDRPETYDGRCTFWGHVCFARNGIGFRKTVWFWKLVFFHFRTAGKVPDLPWVGPMRTLGTHVALGIGHEARRPITIHSFELGALGAHVWETPTSDCKHCGTHAVQLDSR